MNNQKQKALRDSSKFTHLQSFLESLQSVTSWRGI